jgi:hypothetical protein
MLIASYFSYIASRSFSLAKMSFILALAAAVFSTAITAASLADVCTTSYVQSILPTDLYAGTVALTVDPSSATANTVYNSTTTGSVM